MEETPLEKIVVPCFKSIGEEYANKLWHNNSKYAVIANVNRCVYIPWFCGRGGGNHKDNPEEDNVCFKEFLQDPCYFYRCRHNGLVTEYVVTPCFYALIPHKKSCENPAVCNHTFDYMVRFLMASEKEQLDKIESLLRKNLYSDRLQFLWMKEDDNQKEDEQLICRIDSSLDFKLNAKNYFYISSSEVKYSSEIKKGGEKLNKESEIIFDKMLKLFSRGVARKDFVRRSGSDFWLILNSILGVQHHKKTNL